jgi:hypothetical protein
VYRSSNPGLGVRVYHMIYHNCCEEHKYLAGIRREKESFERMIKERGVSSIWLPHLGAMLMLVEVHVTPHSGRGVCKQQK